MLSWDISDKRLDAVIQYIKTFAPQVWESKEKKLGNHVELAPDPYIQLSYLCSSKGKGSLSY